jgi:hypothetical protein
MLHLKLLSQASSVLYDTASTDDLIDDVIIEFTQALQSGGFINPKFDLAHLDKFRGFMPLRIAIRMLIGLDVIVISRSRDSVNSTVYSTEVL